MVSHPEPTTNQELNYKKNQKNLYTTYICYYYKKGTSREVAFCPFFCFQSVSCLCPFFRFQSVGPKYTRIRWSQVYADEGPQQGNRNLHDHQVQHTLETFFCTNHPGCVYHVSVRLLPHIFCDVVLPTSFMQE